MAKYEPGDIATFYFVVKEHGSEKIIQGWTDNKEIAKFYMEFHKCKYFKLKSVTNNIEEIYKITIEENMNDEIKLFHIITKNCGKHKKGESYGMVCIPATEVESTFIREEANAFMSSHVNYSLINDAFPYLKKKYQNILQSIFLPDVISKVVYNKNPRFTQEIEFDHLMILFKTFPENFGE